MLRLFSTYPKSGGANCYLWLQYRALEVFARAAPQITLAGIDTHAIEIYHRERDAVIPFAWSEQLCERLGLQLNQLHAFANTGHEFEDREALLREVSKVL